MIHHVMFRQHKLNSDSSQLSHLLGQSIVNRQHSIVYWIIIMIISDNILYYVLRYIIYILIAKKVISKWMYIEDVYLQYTFISKLLVLIICISVPVYLCLLASCRSRAPPFSRRDTITLYSC